MLRIIRLSLCAGLATAAADVPPFTIDSVLASLRQTHPEASRVSDALPPGVEARENLTYVVRDGVALQLDLYRPAGRARLPAVIVVHGGGWLAGDRTMERPFARNLAARGFVAAPVSYRLGRAGRFPEPIYDLKAAVRWLRSHADDYGIDADHIGAVGGSAGGTLAVTLGATNGLAELEGDAGQSTISSSVQAVVDIDGTVTFLDNRLIRSAETEPSPYWEYLHGIYSRHREIWLAASPLYYVSRASAPVLFIRSTASQPVLAGREEMCERLRLLGIDSQLETYPDTPHPFWLVHPWFERALADADAFFSRHLKAEARPAGTP